MCVLCIERMHIVVLDVSTLDFVRALATPLPHNTLKTLVNHLLGERLQIFRVLCFLNNFTSSATSMKEEDQLLCMKSQL